MRKSIGGNMRKKRWEKPKLVILTRGTSEEHVLEMCKAQNLQPSIGVNFTYTVPETDCFRPGNCAQCGTVGTS